MAKRRLAVEIVGDADKLDKAYKDGADGADRFEKRTSGAMDKAGKSSDSFGQKMSGLGDKAAGWGTAIAAGLGGAGVLAAGLFAKGFTDTLDREAGQARLGIQLGLPPEMAKAAGQLSGEVYASGFGESLEESNQAIRYITQNMGGLGDVTKDQMKEMTKGVLTLADAFGEDLNQVTAAAGTLIKTGLAKDGVDALNILTRGLSSPANKAEDLLDTFNEYSTMFRQLGLTGPQVLGLLNQGLAAGARDSDTVADGLKEITLQVQAAHDPMSQAAQAFSLLGINAHEMSRAFYEGGPAAAEALQFITDKLRGVEDPGLRGSLALQLFGTKAEDMQQAVFALDLSNAANQVGSVEGAMNNATAATNTNQAKVEEWKRSMEMNVSDFIAVSVIPWMDTMGQRMENMGHQWQTGTGLVGDFHGGLMLFTDGLIVIRDRGIDPLVGSLQTLFGWLGDCIEKLETFGNWVGGGIGGAIESIRNGTLLGFDTGGVVPGPKGKAQLAVVHGGETIVPTHRPMSNELFFEDGSWRPDDWGAGTGVVNSSGRTYEESQALIARATADMKAGMEFAALGWPEEDVRAIADLIARGGTAGGMASSGATINNFYGPVMGEQDFIQKIRSGNYQAARTGRAFS